MFILFASPYISKVWGGVDKSLSLCLWCVNVTTGDDGSQATHHCNSVSNNNM